MTFKDNDIVIVNSTFYKIFSIIFYNNFFYSNYNNRSDYILQLREYTVVVCFCHKNIFGPKLINNLLNFSKKNLQKNPSNLVEK